MATLKTFALVVAVSVDHTALTLSLRVKAFTASHAAVKAGAILRRRFQSASRFEVTSASTLQIEETTLVIEHTT